MILLFTLNFCFSPVRQDFKKEDPRDYIVYLPDQEALNQITKSEFLTIHDTHWGIESFHRAIKQVCGIYQFMVRDSQGIKTQIFCSVFLIAMNCKVTYSL